MRKFLVLFAAVAVIFVGCEQLDSSVNVKVKTLDATNVSYEKYTFNAEATIKGLSSANYAEMGVYYGSTPNISKDNKFLTTEVKQAVNGANSYSDSDNNEYEFLGVKSYYFEKGTTIYYKAYVKVIDADGAHYTYGEEKSFTL